MAVRETFSDVYFPFFFLRGSLFGKEAVFPLGNYTEFSFPQNSLNHDFPLLHALFRLAQTD